MNYKRKIVSIIKSSDIYGKEPSLYYKGEEKKSFLLGGILSIIYIIIYILFLIYQFLKFWNKEDFIFYDTFSYNENTPPSISVTKDKFFGGFAIENESTYDPFIDETIYKPKAFFKIKDRRNKEKWVENSTEINLITCNQTSFGEFYKSKFKGNALDNLYCFENVNQTLIGHYIYDYYSFFYIQLFPCKNSTENNNKCKPKEIIEKYLKGTFVCMEFQDIELTPEKYYIPVIPRNQYISFKIGLKLFQEVHIFYQIINVETDEEFIGLDFFQKKRKQQYLKYHSMYQMSILRDNDENEPFCNITFKLLDQIRTQRKKYTTLLEILGNVGGIMEIILISILFTMIISFPIDLLYKISLVNKLFKFDINKKRLIQKNINIKKCKTLYINSSLNKRKSNHWLIKNGSSYRANIGSRNNYIIINLENINTLTKNDFNINKGKLEKSKTFVKKYKDNIKDKLKFKKIWIYFCYCCFKCNKNNYTFLLNKAMKLIQEKMDVIKIIKRR